MLKILVIVFSVLVSLLVLWYLFPIIRINGYSMFPTLKDGEFYVGTRLFRKSQLKVGSIYIFYPPYESEEEKVVVKRLIDVRNGKYCYFLGDNSNESFDSRSYGFVSCDKIIARVLTRK